MKKLVALLLSALICFSSVSAFAAGKLRVVQENFHVVESFFTYGYAYAKVENVGDKPIRVNAGVLEIYDESGEVITSTDYLNSNYAYLQPGEYTYVSIDDEIEGAAEGVAAADYMLTITGKSDSSYVYSKLPATSAMELNVTNGWMTYNYLYATVTNDTSDPVYDIKVVYALLDDTGNILYIDTDSVYGVALAPGSTMIFRKDISSSFMEYFAAKGLTPSTLDVIAYTEEYE